MARKVVGPTGSRRRRWLFLCTAMAAIAMAVLFIPSAFAVHDTGAFELDGNATAATTSDDWDRVCYQVAVNGGATAAAATAQCTATQGLGSANTGAAWVNDGALNATIFTGGGSKDPSDVSSWGWKTDTGGLPDKDNLIHAYATEYSLAGTASAGTCPNGTDLAPPIGNNSFDSTVNCRVLYFGSDRYDNSGDAQQGFWFFQNKVGTSTGGSFSGVHKNGDVLVISDFSNGGTTSTITVYKWDSTCKKGATSPTAGQCGDSNLRLLSTSTDALCGASLGQNDNACGIVNSGTITMPWSFLDKSGTTTNRALNGEFFEAGINLSTLGLAGECFSAVASETRSSTSTTATLKDFVLGGFEKCTPALTTQVKNGSGTSTNGTVQPGTAVHDTAKVTVSGAQNPADATGTVDFFLCGPNATQAPDCSTGGTPIGGDVTLTDTSNPANTSDGVSGGSSDDVNGTGHALSNGYYCFRAEAHTTNYDSPSNYTDSTTECFQVLKLDTSIVTSPQSPSGTDNTGPFNLKDSPTIYDHAVVTGVTGGGFPEGTVAFYICTPGDVTGTSGHEICPSTAGNQVGAVKNLNHVSGETIKSDATSDGYSITSTSALGVYCFRAVYGSTSAVYNGTSGGDHTECFTVQNAASGSSQQNWLPNDQIFIKSDAGSIPGTLTVQLVKGACDPNASGATLIYTDTSASSFTASATGSGAEYDTTNSTHKVSTAGPDDYYWRAVFTPTSSFAGTAVTVCEKSTLTISNTG
jgi:hypothetical protein